MSGATAGQQAATRPRELLLATRNPGKVREFRALLAHLPLTVLSAADVDGLPEVDETGTTFAENAIRKAVALAEASGRLALADDSGIEVDALGGAPGVYSARYAGPGADDAANRRKLLAALDGVPDGQRTGRFRCAIALAAPDGLLTVVEAAWDGTVARAERGSGGFGYDSIFVPDGGVRTAAELTPEEKNAVSHRAQALQKMVRWLERWLGGARMGDRMRIGLISDTHGNLEAARRAWRAMTADGDIDCVLHAGDFISDARALAAEWPVPVHAVRGNNDLWDTGDDVLTLELGGQRILLVHGHRHNVSRSRDLSTVAAAARQAGAQVAVFGHSHVPRVTEMDGVLLVNPGSPSRPRDGHGPTCAVLTITADGCRAELLDV